MALTKQDKEELRLMMRAEIRTEVRVAVKEVVAEEVTPRFDRLEAKITGNHTVVMNHLLVIKQQNGSLQKEFTQFKEGIAKAAR